MNLFMCVNYPIYNPAIGISKKIRSQIENFQKLGYHVTYSAYTMNSIVIYRDDELIDEMYYPAIVPRRLYGVLRKFYWLKAVKRFLENSSSRYDLGFVRWGAVDRSLLNTLRTMDKKCGSIIMDFHGYHTAYKGHTAKGIYIEKTTNANGNKLAKYIDVGLTETKNTELFGVPTIPMDTGVDVEKFQPHKYVGPPDEIHMVSVANELSYHGYDRIIKGIAQYGARNVFLHLVGKMNEGTVQLVSKLGLNERVILHGYQTGKALDDIYSHSNIGVGPLAPHRIGGKEGTGIKTKEYFAIGLPYFYAGQELLVPDDYPYVLKLESDESPIDVGKVIDFYHKIKDDKGMQENMRDFARENFSWEKVFMKAISALDKQKQ